jgi:hypothetical protein
MSDSSIIDFVEGYFQRSLDHGLVDDLRSRRITFDKDELNVAYSAWRQCETVPSRDSPDFRRHWALKFEPARLPPQKQPGHLRPYLPIETLPTSGKPNTGYFVFDSTEDDLWSTVDAIKHHLLYCHSVAIENPMAVWMMDKGGALTFSRAANLQKGILGWQFNSSIIMAQWLSFLTHVRPLIESGALIIVEEQARDPWILKVVPGIDKQALEATASRMGLTSVDFRIAVWKLDLLVRARSRVQGNLDLDLSDPEVESLVKKLLEQGSDFGGPLKVQENAALATLIKAELPAIEHLSIDDLVAVRRNSDEFESWRRGIEKVARKIAQEVPGNLPASEHAYELSRRFRGEVLDLGRDLEANISRQPVHIKVGKTALKFAVGAAVGGLFGWPFGLTVVAAELVRDFAKTIAESLVETEGKSGSSSVAQQALAGLYVAFSNE